LDRPPLSTELSSAGVFAGVLLPYATASLAPLLVRLSRACRDSESRDQQGYADRQYAAHWQSMFQRRQIIRTQDLRQRRPGELSSPGRPRFTVDTPIHVSLPTTSYSKILGTAWVRRPIDGGGLSGLACRSPGPARSTREDAADVHCGSGFWGGQRPSLAPYVTGMGPMDGATAAGGRSCCLSSRRCPQSFLFGQSPTSALSLHRIRSFCRGWK